MTKTEWYRRTTWTNADRAEFDTKLRRARDKAQYLRIQALHLAEVGLWPPAIELLQRILTDFPDALEIAQVHLQLAHAFANTGKTEYALNEFLDSLEKQRQTPSWQTNAWLDYAKFVVTKRIETHYVNVRSILNEFCTSTSLTFPFHRYVYFACLALIDEHDGDLGSAKSNASRAIDARNETHSGFRYHPTVGLVDKSNDPFLERLGRLITR